MAARREQRRARGGGALARDPRARATGSASRAAAPRGRSAQPSRRNVGNRIARDVGRSGSRTDQKKRLGASQEANKAAPKPERKFDAGRAQTRINWLKKNRPNDPEIKALQKKLNASAPPPSNQGTQTAPLPADLPMRNPSTPAPGTPYEQMTREQQVDQAFEQGGAAYGNITNRFMNFDPYQMQAQYQQGFTNEMDRARSSLMDQFNRRNADEFKRQDLATQQQIVERGLDPNSEAAQALMKANTQRQDLARQEAMSAAEQAAQGLQQQGFQQSYQTAMAPYEQFQAIQQPLNAGMGAQYAQEQAAQGQQYGLQTLGQQQQYNLQTIAQQQQYAKEMERLQQKNRLEQIRATPRGGGGGAAQPDYFSQYMYGQFLPQQYAPQQGQGAPNPWASAAQGFAQGAGAALVKAVS